MGSRQAEPPIVTKGSIPETVMNSLMNDQNGDAENTYERKKIADGSLYISGFV